VVVTAGTETPLRCEECDRPWRADWIDDEVGVRFWCPNCWTREFQSD
jgi:hypothetical protein